MTSSRLLSEISKYWLEKRETRSRLKIPTGFSALDSLIDGGIERGTVVFVCSKTGHGKSTLITNIQTNISFDGGRALVFSLEDPSSVWYFRALSRVANVPFGALTDHNKREIDFLSKAFVDACQMIGLANLHVCDERIRHSNDCLWKAVKHAQEFGGDLIVLDNLSELDDGMYGDGIDISPAVQTLSMMAKATDCVVIVAAHVNDYQTAESLALIDSVKSSVWLLEQEDVDEELQQSVKNLRLTLVKSDTCEGESLDVVIDFEKFAVLSCEPRGR